MNPKLLALSLSLSLSLVTAGTLIAGDVAPADQPVVYPDVAPSDWEFDLLLYGWAAGLNGNVGVNGVTSALDVGFDDVINNLDMVASGTVGIRKGKVGFFGDFLYLKISPSFETPGPAFNRTDLTLAETMVDLKGSYRLAEWQGGWFEVIAGARYLNVDIDIGLQPGLAPGVSTSGSQSWWDAVGGFRARHQLTDRLYLTALGDVGGGSSELTWQILAGFGYNVTENVYATLAYRYLDTEYYNGGFTYDVATDGVVIGLGYKW